MQNAENYIFLMKSCEYCALEPMHHSVISNYLYKYQKHCPAADHQSNYWPVRNIPATDPDPNAGRLLHLLSHLQAQVRAGAGEQLCGCPALGSVQDGELGEVHVFLNGAVARGGPGGGTRLFLEPVTSPSLVK